MATKLTLDLSEDAMRALDELSANSGLSRVDVLRRALDIARHTDDAVSRKAMIFSAKNFPHGGGNVARDYIIDQVVRQVTDVEGTSSNALPQERLAALSQIPLVISSVIIPRRQVLEGKLIETTSIVWDQIVQELQNDWSIAYRLPPEKLEEIVAGAFHRDGYDEVTLTKRSGDAGRDVIATKKGIGGVKVITSVKRYAEKRLVKYDDVRALLGVMSGELDTSKGIIATTSDFPKALPNARFIQPFLPTRLELVNGQSLLKWLARLAKKR